MSQDKEELSDELRGQLDQQLKDAIQSEQPDLKKIEELIKAHPELKHPKLRSHYATPLFFAISYSSLEAVKLLLTLNLNIVEHAQIKHHFKRSRKNYGEGIPPKENIFELKDLYLPNYWRMALERGQKGDPKSIEIAQFVLQEIYNKIVTISNNTENPEFLTKFAEMPGYESILSQIKVHKEDTSRPSYMKCVTAVFNQEKANLEKLNLYYQVVNSIDQKQAADHVEHLFKLFLDDKKEKVEQAKDNFTDFINQSLINPFTLDIKLAENKLSEDAASKKIQNLSGMKKSDFDAILSNTKNTWIVPQLAIESGGPNLNLLDVAILKGNDKIVQFLLEHKAKPSHDWKFSDDQNKFPALVERCFNARLKNEPNNAALKNIQKLLEEHRHRLKPPIGRGPWGHIAV